MNYRNALIIVGSVASLASFLAMRTSSHAAPPATPDRASTQGIVIAGPGLVEAASEEVELTPEVGGRLVEVFVDEGDAVTAGDVLARIEDRDYRARVDSAEAHVTITQAERQRLINGARKEERDEARAAAEQASASRDHAQVQVERARRLFDGGVIPRERLDDAERDIRVAEARSAEAAARAALVDASARADELDRANAQVAAALATLAESRAALAKTVVRAPIGGLILRRHKRAGESVSLMNGASAILTMSDIRVLRVRMEVDERDIARLRPNQRAFVTAAAFGDQRFPGRVVRISHRLGRKNVSTGEPTERTDTKVLETLIALDHGVALPIGLRVDAFIETGEDK